MYSVAEFGRMITDEVRMGAYDAALRTAVRPGTVVLDIGAGTGILSLLACRYGAAKVYAVEVGDGIEVGREIARANGLADRIEFIQAQSTDITLPGRADVIVSDLRGVMPLLQEHIPSIADARRRHLAPGGALIPQRDDLWVGLVEAPKAYDRLVAPWATGLFGFEMSPARQIVTNTWERAFFGADDLLAAPVRWGTLDYATIESPNVCGTVTLQAARAGAAHGLALWFDAVLSDGVSFSNAPGKPETVYGTAFLPFSEPIAIEAGEQLSVALRADLVGALYVWTWDTTAFGPDGSTPRVQLHQSTFFGGPLPLDKIRKRAGAHAPVLGDDGEIDATILRAMTGTSTLDELATQVLERFPGRFHSRSAALARVSDLSERYSR